MALGAGKLLGAGDTAVVNYAVSITPTFVTVSEPNNGSASSPLLTATVTGGVGPFTYAWTTDQPNYRFSPNSADTQSLTVVTNGYNAEFDGKVTCTVTDTGNVNLETSGDAFVSFVFGNA